MYISITDIKNYVFCPLRFYYSYCMNLSFPKLYWDDLGKTEEERIKNKVKEKIKEKYEILEIEDFLISEHFKLQGKPDLLLKDRKYNYYLVLEIKNSKKVKEEFLYSLAAYAILVEDNNFYPVKKLLFYLIKIDKIIEINFSSYLRKKTIEIIKNIQKIITTGLKPYPKLERCSLCDFRDYCPEWKK